MNLLDYLFNYLDSGQRDALDLENQDNERAMGLYSKLIGGSVPDIWKPTQTPSGYYIPDNYYNIINRLGLQNRPKSLDAARLVDPRMLETLYPDETPGKYEFLSPEDLKRLKKIIRNTYTTAYPSFDKNQYSKLRPDYPFNLREPLTY